MGGREGGIDAAALTAICADIAAAARETELAIVIGGGNILRGAALGALSMERASADYMGMLATAINALALCGALEHAGAQARVMSAIAMEQVMEAYARPKALKYLEEGKIVIFACGTGNPFFTTDTAAALRGAEIGAQIVLKATKVDGIYSADPRRNSQAQRYERISFDEAIAQRLEVMDATAFALCRDRNLPIRVFSLFAPGALGRAVRGENEGTLVYV